MPPSRIILLVEPCTERRRILRCLLEPEGERVLSARDAATAREHLGLAAPAVAVLPGALPDLADVVALLRDRDAQAQVVLLGPAPEGESPRSLMRRFGAVGWHEAGDAPERLLLALEAAARAFARAQQLEMGDRLKTELLANVSHELRTPLSVILGYLDLVSDGTFGACAPEACEVLAKARGNASWLLDLVEEFLDLSQVEAGAAHVRRDAIDPGPLLRELAEAFDVLIREKPIEFVADVPETLPAVAADPAKLRIIVQNLLANAAKFTQHGRISLVAAACRPAGVRIAVQDTGPGIAAEHHEAVFDPFRQLGDGGAHGGVGLGLALARRFARMMGGDLTLASAVGAGSTFTLTLPPVCGPEARSEAA